MKKVILVIKGELTDLNTYINAERINRFKAAKLKKANTEIVYWACKEQKIRQLPKITSVVFSWYNRNARKDFDNIEFAQKFIWDGMVLAKVIPDDSQKYTPDVRSHEHYANSAEPRIEVALFF